jgi:hypothetical protein
MRLVSRAFTWPVEAWQDGKWHGGYKDCVTWPLGCSTIGLPWLAKWTKEEAIDLPMREYTSFSFYWLESLSVTHSQRVQNRDFYS